MFPTKSIEYCLSFVPESAEVKVIFYEDPVNKQKRIVRGFQDAGFKALPKFLSWKKKALSTGFYEHFLHQFKLDFSNETKRATFEHCSHHLSHAASAFFASPFEKAAVLVVDSVGESECTSIWKGNGSSIEKIASIEYPDSVGLLYSAFTQYCGFKVDSGEYKLMGMAPYGKPIYKEKISNSIIKFNSDGSYCLNMEYFDFKYGKRITNEKFEKLMGRPSRVPESDLEEFYCDVAASIQALLNDIMVKLARKALCITDMSKLCLAGGVALNCTANNYIGNEVGVNNLWIQPAAGDAGCALGSALWSYYKDNERLCIKSDIMEGALLGPSFSQNEIIKVLDERNISYTILSEKKYDVVAGLLSDKKIIGMFQGRMEFGPRALGCRSILADPRIEDAQKTINMRIKFRESFRPFAPIVLKEDCEKYFDISCHNPYMMIVGSIKENFRIKVNKDKLLSLDSVRSSLPAITHVDYSARVQVVDEKNQNYITDLLKCFKEKTGIGCLINTSFNVRGEPIVCTIEDALNCFTKTDIDYLVLNDILVGKSNA